MLKLNKKRQILLKYQSGKNKSEISRELGVSRKTIRKYIIQYEEKSEKLSNNKTSGDDITNLIEELSTAPKYDASSRKANKLTEEMTEIIEKCLSDNEEKKRNRKQKQVMKKIDIYEQLIENEYNIGYTTVCNYIRKNTLVKEAYIKQNYEKGDVLEFDWGEVKLTINGKEKKFQLALFTTAYGSYHYARLYNNQKMESFLDIHVRAFRHFDGVYKKVVYDNMRVAVKKFIGPTEKEATEDLIKISMYYGFDYRFCNARRGNEKGHVERGVEFVRRKSFSRNLEYASLEEANKHLLEILENINSKPRKWMENKSPTDKFNEEKQYLIALNPDYIISKESTHRVSKYSTITIEQNKYSVPEILVNKCVDARTYPEIIKIYFDGELIATHKRSYGLQKWILDINHYIETLKRKPGSLKHSISLQCLERRLQEIYKKYYSKIPKEFLELLEIIREKSLEEVEKVIIELLKQGEKRVTTENIKNIINQEKTIILEEIEQNEIEVRSLELLEKTSKIFLSSIEIEKRDIN